MIPANQENIGNENLEDYTTCENFDDHISKERQAGKSTQRDYEVKARKAIHLACDLL